MSARGFLGAGDLYIARYNSITGLFEAFKGPYEATKFEIKPNTELKEMTSRGRSSYGQVIESVPLPKPVDFTVDLPEVNKESLAIALMGTTSTFTQGSGTITDEVITAELDGWVRLSKENLAEAGFVVTNSAGTTTYVNGTDYIFNARLGMIKALTGGAITQGQSLKVDCSYAAQSGIQIAGSTQSQVRAKFFFDGINFADQLPVHVDVYEAVISAQTAFDFLSDNFASISLPGRLKTPTGKTEPYKVKLLNA